MAKKSEREFQRQNLRDLIPEGSTVYGIFRSVAPSGMSAVISLVVFVDGRPLWPNYGIGMITDHAVVSKNGRDGLRVSGCGFNRLQHIVDRLAQELYGRADALKYQDL